MIFISVIPYIVVKWDPFFSNFARSTCVFLLHYSQTILSCSHFVLLGSDLHIFVQILQCFGFVYV